MYWFKGLKLFDTVSQAIKIKGASICFYDFN